MKLYKVKLLQLLFCIVCPICYSRLLFVVFTRSILQHLRKVLYANQHSYTVSLKCLWSVKWSLFRAWMNYTVPIEAGKQTRLLACKAVLRHRFSCSLLELRTTTSCFAQSADDTPLLPSCESFQIRQQRCCLRQINLSCFHVIKQWVFTRWSMINCLINFIIIVITNSQVTEYDCASVTHVNGGFIVTHTTLC